MTKHSWIQSYHPFYLERICKGCGIEQRAFEADNEWGKIFKAPPTYVEECDGIWKHPDDRYPREAWTFDDEHWPGAWVTEFFPKIIENQEIYLKGEAAMAIFKKRPLPVEGPVELWKE